MKVAGRVLAVATIKGKMLMKCQMNGHLPKVGDSIVVKYGRARSNEQNALMWAYLTFLFNDCDLKSEYGTVDELHETLKATFLSKRVFHGGKEFIHVGSTTSLGKVEFGEYLDKINKAMIEFQGINPASFWSDYKDNKDGKVSLELTDEGRAAKARGEF